jgi:hypothetical protein
MEHSDRMAAFSRAMIGAIAELGIGRQLAPLVGSNEDSGRRQTSRSACSSRHPELSSPLLS